MFDTSILDEAIRARRQKLAAEQAELLAGVRRTLLELRKPLGIEAAYIVGSLRSPDSWRESSGKEVDVIDLDQHPSPNPLRSLESRSMDSKRNYERVYETSVASTVALRNA